MRGEGVGEGLEVVRLAVNEHIDDVAIHYLFDVRVVVLPPREPHLASLQLIPLTLYVLGMLSPTAKGACG
jgi:hypothetical protein